MTSIPFPLRLVRPAVACAAVLAVPPATTQIFSPVTQLSVQNSAPGDTLRMTVGQSLVLHGSVPMKRVFVGNPAVLSSFNPSATDVLITAKEAGTSSLAIWDSNGGQRIYKISSDFDPTDLQQSIDQMYPKETVRVSAVGERLQLNGTVSTPEIFDSLTKLSGAYSKQVANSLRVVAIRPRQVELKLQIVEVDRTKRDQFAVNFTSDGKVPATTGTGTFSNPLNISVGYLKESIALNIQALAQHSVLQILAEPTLTTLSGQPARFLSGGEFPIPVAQAAATGSGSAITIQFRPYGVKVDFLPLVDPDGSIRLKVSPEVSTLDYSNAVTISGFTIPALSTRRAETEVQLKDGQSFVLSGLLDHRTIENLGRVPGISKVPILGEIFRSRNDTHSLTELVFVVTAKVIDPLLEPAPIHTPRNSEPYMEAEPFDKEVRQKKAAIKQQ